MCFGKKGKTFLLPLGILFFQTRQLLFSIPHQLCDENIHAQFLKVKPDSVANFDFGEAENSRKMIGHLFYLKFLGRNDLF